MPDVLNPDTARTVGGDLELQTADLAARVDVTIATVPDLERAVAARATLADMRRRVVDYFAPLKQMAFALHRTLCARELAILSPLDARDGQIRDAMSTFKADQDRIRRDQEAAEQAARQRDLEAHAAQEAARLEAHGAPELAAAVLEEAIAAPPPWVALPDVTRGAGAKFRRVWRWRYAGGPADVETTPPDVLARALAAVPREFLRLDETKVGAYARAMKSSAAIPGIEVYAVDAAVR